MVTSTSKNLTARLPEPGAEPAPAPRLGAQLCLSPWGLAFPVCEMNISKPLLPPPRLEERKRGPPAIISALHLQSPNRSRSWSVIISYPREFRAKNPNPRGFLVVVPAPPAAHEEPAGIHRAPLLPHTPKTGPTKGKNAHPNLPHLAPSLRASPPTWRQPVLAREKLFTTQLRNEENPGP